MSQVHILYLKQFSLCIPVCRKSQMNAPNFNLKKTSLVNHFKAKNRCQSEKKLIFKTNNGPKQILMCHSFQVREF